MYDWRERHKKSIRLTIWLPYCHPLMQDQIECDAVKARSAPDFGQSLERPRTVDDKIPCDQEKNLIAPLSCIMPYSCKQAIVRHYCRIHLPPPEWTIRQTQQNSDRQPKRYSSGRTRSAKWLPLSATLNSIAAASLFYSIDQVKMTIPSSSDKIS